MTYEERIEAAAKLLEDDEFELYEEPLSLHEIVARRVVEAFCAGDTLYVKQEQVFNKGTVWEEYGTELVPLQPKEDT